MDLLSEVMTLRFVCQGRCRRLRREDRNDRAKRAGRGQEIAALIARNDARSARTGYTKGGHTQNMVLTMVKFPTMQVVADSILARVTKKAHQRTKRPITLKEKKARTKP